MAYILLSNDIGRAKYVRKPNEHEMLEPFWHSLAKGHSLGPVSVFWKEKSDSQGILGKIVRAEFRFLRSLNHVPECDLVKYSLCN